jgi:hypothetical protein
MTNNLIGRQIRVVVAALSFLLSAGSAFAESVRVVVEGATIWRTPTGTGGIIEVVKAGTVLDVRGRQGRWVIVESSTDVRQIGYILAAQTEPVAAGPNTRQPPAAQTLPPGGRSPLPQTRAQAPPPRRPPPKPRPFLYGGVMFQVPPGIEVKDTRTTLLEPETRKTKYATSLPGFEVGGGAGIAQRFTLGGLFVMRSSSGAATVSAQIPHPIFYGQPRTLEGSFDSTGTETAAHVQIGFTAYQSPRFGLVVAGGPSFYWVTQDLLDQLSYTETYPYDSVTFTGATTRTETADAVGGNVQLDAIVSLSKQFSWQTSGRWGFGSVTFEGTTESAKVGQGQISTGIRVTF